MSSKIVGYLRNKPTGATLDEARAILKAKPLDGRKLKAYQVWGIINFDGDRLSLTDAGWTLARTPDQAVRVYRSAIDMTRPYRSAIEWAYHQQFEELTVTDLTAHWHQHHQDALGTGNETAIKDAVTCFFNLADAAGLGKYFLGRSGRPTRLELKATEVKAFVEAGPSTPPWTGPLPEDVQVPSEQEEVPTLGAEADEAAAVEVASAELVVPPPGFGKAQENGDRTEALRVFIAHGKNMRIVEQVQTVLDLADITSEVAEEEETAAIPVPEKVLTAMRRCGAGIICVSVDERRRDDGGQYAVNENVLIEIGAAFVLYDQRVVLLWDRRLSIPSNLQGLYRCEFEGEELTWDAGTKLMKAIQGFKR
jgi:hypothetical protein